MRALGKVLGGFSSKKDRSFPPINDSIASSICLAVTFLNDNYCDEEGLYRIPGDTDETEKVYVAIMKGRLTDNTLESAAGPHCIASAIKRVLASHEPLLTYRYYDAFLSVDADYSELLTKLPRTNQCVLDTILPHIDNIAGSSRSKMNYNSLAICFGVQLLRPASADSTANNTDLPTATAELKTRERAVVALFSSRKSTSKSLEGKIESLINEDGTSFATVQQRTIKISAPSSNPMDEETLEEIKARVHEIGNVMHMAAKDARTLVAMFATRHDAERCVKHLSLPANYKVKLLDPTPLKEVSFVKDMTDVIDTEVDEPETTQKAAIGQDEFPADTPKPITSPLSDDVHTIDSFQDLSTIQHKTMNSDVVYLNDFSSESEHGSDGDGSVDEPPVLSPLSEDTSHISASPLISEESIVEKHEPRVIVRKSTAKIIHVGGEPNTTTSQAEADHTEAAPPSPIAVPTTVTVPNPASPTSPNASLSITPEGDVRDVAMKLFRALDSDAVGVLEPTVLLRAFNRNKKFLEWLQLTNNEASELISCLKTYRGDISSDEFVELVLATHKSLEEVVHDSDESVDSLPELAADKKSVESEAVAIPTVIPTPKPVLPTPSVPPPDPVARLSDILLKNRRKQPSITPHREVRTRDPTHAYDRYSLLKMHPALPVVSGPPVVTDNKVLQLQQEVIDIRAEYEQLLQAKQSELLLQQQSETAYLTELTAVRRRVADLESALMIEKDSLRRIKMESCKKDAELKCLLGAKGQTDDYAATIKDAAEREALSTVMAQQRLISLLESERDAATATSAAMKQEVEALAAAHKEAVNEAFKWKGMYMALRKNNSDEYAASQNVEPEEVKEVKEVEETDCLSTIAQDAVNKYLTQASKQQHATINEPPVHVTPEKVLQPYIKQELQRPVALSPTIISSARDVSVTSSTKAPATTADLHTSPGIMSAAKVDTSIVTKENDEPSYDTFLHDQRTRFQQALEAQSILSDKLLRSLASARKDLTGTEAFSVDIINRRVPEPRERHIARSRREYVPRSEKFSEWYFNS